MRVISFSTRPFTETVQAVGQQLPFLFREPRLALEDRDILLSLDGVALLRRADDTGADGVQEVPMGQERLLHLGVRRGW